MRRGENIWTGQIVPTLYDDNSLWFWRAFIVIIHKFIFCRLKGRIFNSRHEIRELTSRHRDDLKRASTLAEAINWRHNIRQNLYMYIDIVHIGIRRSGGDLTREEKHRDVARSPMVASMFLFSCRLLKLMLRDIDISFSSPRILYFTLY